MVHLEPLLCVDEIQANIVPGFATSHQRLIGVRFGGDVGAARQWLAECAGRLTTIRGDFTTWRLERREWKKEGRTAPRPRQVTWLNLGLSRGGLKQLAGSDRAGAIWDPWFRSGMWSVAGSLGDGSTEDWVLGGCEEDTPHVLVVLGNDDEHSLIADGDQLVALAKDFGCRVPEGYDVHGATLPDGHEHFGFKDGVSVPAVRGRVGPSEFLYKRTLDPDDRRAARFAKPGQVLVWPGQAVFGYPAQSRTDLVEPGAVAHGGAEWMRNGSLLVFRRLRQHVERFNRFAEEAAKTGARVDAARIKAYLVGRWPNGTPLVEYPDAEPVSPPDDINMFDFANDLDGVRCPLFAHVRKVNPRNAPTDLVGESATLALQPFRRGIPYGPPYTEGAEDDDRGMLFLAYATSIRDSFGALSVGWMNRPDAPEQGRYGWDLLTGQNERPDEPRFGRLHDDTKLTTRERWVEPTGGGFFFVPSRTLLGKLARGQALEPRSRAADPAEAG
jgi:Dyp-type peroxidase family